MSLSTAKESKGCDYFAREMGILIAKTLYEVSLRVKNYGVAFRRRDSDVRIRECVAGRPRTRHTIERGVNRLLVAIISRFTVVRPSAKAFCEVMYSIGKRDARIKA